MKNFDLIIIGGGAGGFAAAIRANELQINTALVNTGLPLGGTCVNVGCLPSKILIQAGEVLHMVKNHNIAGIELELKKFDFNKVIQEELRMVEMSRKDKYADVLSNLKYVSLIEGQAKFISAKQIEVAGVILSAKKFIIAAGSTADVPAIKNIKKINFLTHIEALRLKSLPKKLVIIGAGPVGLEFAQMYARFGTKVTILHRDNTIISRAEPELIGRLMEIFTAEGITLRTNVEVEGVIKKANKKIISCKIAGKSEKIIATEILLAAGKTPNTAKLGLENVGVKINSQQAIVVNKYFQTNRPYIFAIGDVSDAPLRLETTAGREGSLAVENIISGAKNTIDYNSVAYTIFTSPQFASVGWTEKRQKTETGICACRTVPFKIIPKAQIIRRTEGLIKMVIDPDSKRILGVHILAPNAGDLIAQATILIKNRNTIDDVCKSMPVFPTLSESLKYVALAFSKDLTKLSCCI